jgi:hypothetical protein
MAFFGKIVHLKFAIATAIGLGLSGLACSSDSTRDRHDAEEPAAEQTSCVDDDSCGPAEYCEYPIGNCGMSGTGLCVVKPLVCGNYGQPTCGCDGIEWGNDCQPKSAGRNVLHDGRCDGTPVTIDPEPSADPSVPDE